MSLGVGFVFDFFICFSRHWIVSITETLTIMAASGYWTVSLWAMHVLSTWYSWHHSTPTAAPIRSWIWALTFKDAVPFPRSYMPPDHTTSKRWGRGVEEPRSRSAEDSWVTQKLYSPSARYYKSDSSPNNWASVPGHAVSWALSGISSPDSHQQKCGDLPSSFGKEGKSEEVMWSPKVIQHETELWSESRFSKPVNQCSGSVLMKSSPPHPLLKSYIWASF